MGGDQVISVDGHIERKERKIADTLIFILLCGIPIFANLSFGAASSGSFVFVMLLTGLIPVFWMAYVFQTGKLAAAVHPTQLALLALLLLGLVQLLPLAPPEIPQGTISTAPASALSLQPNATRMAVIRLFVFLVFYAAALRFIDSPSRIRKLSVTLLVFGSLMAFFSVLQFLSNPDVIYGIVPAAQARPFGSYINQHHFASFLVMIFAVGVGLLVGGGTKRDKLVFFAIAVIVLGTAVIFTGSRGAFLSLVAVLAFLACSFLLLNRRDARRHPERHGRASARSAVVFGGAAAGLIVVLMIVAFWAGGEQGILRGAGMQTAGEDFSTGRIQFWTGALRIFYANPVIGAGLESFAIAYTKVDPGSGLYRPEFAHNEYLQMLADGGVVGLLIVTAFVFFLFRGAFRTITGTKDRYHRSVAVGALAGCFGVMVHSVVDFPLRTSANMFFFLLLATLAVSKVNSSSIRTRSASDRF